MRFGDTKKQDSLSVGVGIRYVHSLSHTLYPSVRIVKQHNPPQPLSIFTLSLSLSIQGPKQTREHFLFHPHSLLFSILRIHKIPPHNRQFILPRPLPHTTISVISPMLSLRRRREMQRLRRHIRRNQNKKDVSMFPCFRRRARGMVAHDFSNLEIIVRFNFGFIQTRYVVGVGNGDGGAE